MLFVDGVVFSDETREGVNDKLECRRHALYSRGLE